MGRRIVWRRLEPGSRLERTTNDCRLFVGAGSHSVGPRRGDRRDCSVHSKTFKRIVRLTWFRRSACARHDLYDAKSSLVCASESILRVVGSHAVLLLWRTWFGRPDAETDPSGMYGSIAC